MYHISSKMKMTWRFFLKDPLSREKYYISSRENVMHIAMCWNAVFYQSRNRCLTVSWFSNFATECWQIWPKFNIPFDLDKCNGSELLVSTVNSWMETIVNILDLGNILLSRALFSWSRTMAYPRGPPFTNLVYFRPFFKKSNIWLQN